MTFRGPAMALAVFSWGAWGAPDGGVPQGHETAARLSDSDDALAGWQPDAGSLSAEDRELAEEVEFIQDLDAASDLDLLIELSKKE